MGNRDQHQDRDMESRNRRDDDQSEQGTNARSGAESGQGSMGQGSMGQGTPSGQGDSGVMGGESWQDRNRQGSDDQGDTSTAGRDEQTSRS